MNYMVIINDLQIGDKLLFVQDIANTLVKNEIWLFTQRTARVKHLKIGDRVVIYAAGKGNRCFIGNFILRTAPSDVSGDYPTELKDLLRYFPLHCQIENVSLWSKPLSIKNILEDLSFIGDKKNYGLYLRQGMRELSDRDYDVIIEANRTRK